MINNKVTLNFLNLKVQFFSPFYTINERLLIDLTLC